MAKIERALVTVEDKTGVAEFARRLRALDIEIIATGGTGHLLRESGVEALDVSEYTGFPEILEGWLRTMHPKLFAGLLARRDEKEHLRELQQYGIRTIDMVVVNLYPFLDVISEPGLPMMRTVDNIDIAGPTLVRSAAKNYTHVAVVTDPADYDRVALELEQSDGSLSEQTHFQLALEAFRHTARYDMIIARQMAGMHGPEEAMPARLLLEFDKKMDLPRGESPHQQAAFYVEERLKECSVSNSCRVSGRSLSFVDILNLDAGIGLAKEFARPGVVLAARGDICGAARADCLRDAFQKSRPPAERRGTACGLVLNRPLEPGVAEAIVAAGRELVAALAAPEHSEEALDMFHRDAAWRDLPVLETPPLDWCSVDEKALDMRRVTGGMLVQSRDLSCLNAEVLESAGQPVPDSERMADVRLAWACARHARPAAAAGVADETLVGLGRACPSAWRAIGACLQDAPGDLRGGVVALDSPLTGAAEVERLAQAGVEIVVQPGGSEADQEVGQAAERLGVMMILTAGPQSRH